MEIVILRNESGEAVRVNVQQGDADYETTIPENGQLTLLADPTPSVTYLGS